MNLKVDKALIKKYLDGDCDDKELELVRDFLKQENAQQIFDEVWNEQWADKIKADNVVSNQVQNSDWKNKIHQRINQESLNTETVVVPIRTPFIKRIANWQYAAILALLFIGAGLWVVTNKKTQEQTSIAYVEKHNGNGRRTIITLPDSSTVYLGPDSKLRYAEKFSGNTREIKLEGEAFFEVTKNPKKPFIIHTGIITTKVLGTSFKVEAFLNKPVTVSVSTGKVRVDRHTAGKTESLAVLIPGQTVTWNETNHLKTLGEAVVTDISSWKDGRLVFNQVPLSEIAHILERWYDVDISFSDKKTALKLMKVNLTANVPINTLMKILSVSGQFKYNIQGNHITIN
ncbi:FecR family protein [Pedobacter foliorum]|uniref:FecR family protein n=1 Tax=Pedobacter foliorum TaxID=2739058 RepID=UPI0015635FE2|nr:FecR family protein [Pedobacter foliorum]NRF41136.1 FecR domain-containing protein [Pedobacter foliorum]